MNISSSFPSKAWMSTLWPLEFTPFLCFVCSGRHVSTYLSFQSLKFLFNPAAHYLLSGLGNEWHFSPSQRFCMNEICSEMISVMRESFSVNWHTEFLTNNSLKVRFDYTGGVKNSRKLVKMATKSMHFHQIIQFPLNHLIIGNFCNLVLCSPPTVTIHRLSNIPL